MMEKFLGLTATPVLCLHRLWGGKAVRSPPWPSWCWVPLRFLSAYQWRGKNGSAQDCPGYTCCCFLCGHSENLLSAWVSALRYLTVIIAHFFLIIFPPISKFKDRDRLQDWGIWLFWIVLIGGNIIGKKVDCWTRWDYLEEARKSEFTLEN